MFVSSHLMSEMALTADHLIVIGRGRLIADTSVADFGAGASKQLIHVRSPHADAFRHLLAAPGVDLTTLEPGLLEVRGLSAEQVGVNAGANHMVFHELTPHQGFARGGIRGPRMDEAPEPPLDALVAARSDKSRRSASRCSLPQ